MYLYIIVFEPYVADFFNSSEFLISRLYGVVLKVYPFLLVLILFRFTLYRFFLMLERGEEENLLSSQFFKFQNLVLNSSFYSVYLNKKIWR